MMNGASNRPIYDSCNYQRLTQISTSPLAYQMYFGKHESCNKCLYDKFYVKYQPEIVDVESELKNITRPLSECDQFKYSPTCKRSGLCLSTFDKSVPVVLAPEVCPIIYNNIPRQTHPGYSLPSANICRNPY
jgi:hypothetical protein